MSNKNSCYSKLTHNHEAFILWPNLYFPNLRYVIFTPLVRIQVLFSLFYFEMLRSCSSPVAFQFLLPVFVHSFPSSPVPDPIVCVSWSVCSFFHRDATQCLLMSGLGMFLFFPLWVFIDLHFAFALFVVTLSFALVIHFCFLWISWFLYHHIYWTATASTGDCFYFNDIWSALIRVYDMMQYHRLKGPAPPHRCFKCLWLFLLSLELCRDLHEETKLSLKEEDYIFFNSTVRQVATGQDRK